MKTAITASFKIINFLLTFSNHSITSQMVSSRILDVAFFSTSEVDLAFIFYSLFPIPRSLILKTRVPHKYENAI